MSASEPDQPVSKGEHTRSALLEAAYERFARHGYHGTSMRAIADSVGIAVGGIYNHFPSKDAIFEAVILEQHPLVRVLPRLRDLEGETATALLRETVKAVLAELDQNPRMVNLVMIELIECQGKHLPALATTLMPHLGACIQWISAASDDLRPLPPMVLAQFFVGMIFSSWFSSRLLQGAGMPADALADADLFVDVLLHGLQRGAASPHVE